MRFATPIVMFFCCLFLCSTTTFAADDSATSAPEAKPLPAGQVVIDLESLHCKTCAKKVSRKLYAVRGVQKVSTDLAKKRVTVTLPTSQPVEPITLWQAVEAGGSKPILLRHADQKIDAHQMQAMIDNQKAAS